MSAPSLDLAAREMLGSFPAARLMGALTALGNHGGFSGARLWKAHGVAGSFCLRAWPAGNPNAERLHTIHQLMKLAQTAGLSFVPTVIPRDSGITWRELAGRLWELTTWIPGTADFHAHPSPSRLEAASLALARLHLTWAGVTPRQGSCPAVQRRLALARDWRGWAASGWRTPPAAANDPVCPWAERASRLLEQWTGRVLLLLEPWAERSFCLQPCLCDIWHDHVLFEGEALTGFVDYGAIKLDQVAVDLARLLGSLVGDDVRQQEMALQAYSRWRPLSTEEQALVTVLDRSGTVLALANWLLWLYRDEKPFEDREAVARQLATFVKRVEAWD